MTTANCKIPFDDRISALLDMSPETGPLDTPLRVTFFKDRRAMRRGEKCLSLRDLADRVEATTARDKGSMRHIKLGRFTGETTAKGSYRHNAAYLGVTGIEGDYDAGEMTVQQAVKALAKAGIAGLIYTTPSHLRDGKGNRWRVLCPLSGETTPDQRERLVARLNGALGGVLSGESFTRAQSYAFGTVKGLEASLDVRLVDGRFLDDCHDLDSIAVGKPKADRGEPAPAVDLSADEWRVGKAGAMLDAAAARLEDTLVERNEALCRDAFMAGGLLANNLVTREQVMESFVPAMSANGYLDDHAGGNKAEVERIIDAQIKAGALHPLDPCADEFDDLKDDEPDIADLLDTTPEQPRKTDSGLTFLTPSECALANPRPYIVKGLIAERDVACIVGAPGVGKSVLAPALAYAVAQGQEAHGRRTKPGRVFYVAAEDEYGMRGRVTALKNEHGDAESFTLVGGVTDLLSEEIKGRGSRHFHALRKAVKEQRPALVVIDTLAMAFPGLEENSAEGMGRVVAVARALTKWGAAVILVHHDTKDGHQGLPRGHSLLNGALDLSIHLTKGADGIVRGRLTKNRNGACDVDLAFRTRGDQVGIDEDGDAVTAAVCQEVDLSIGQSEPRLPPSESAALSLIVDMIGNGETVNERDWRAAAVDGFAISGSENRDSRAKAVARALQGLTAKSIIHVRSGEISLSTSDGITDMFEDFDDD